MRMVNRIFHSMSEIRESGFFWGIHVSTKTHGEILKIISIMNSDVHEATKRVIEGYFILVLYLFHILYNTRCILAECLFK